MRTEKNPHIHEIEKQYAGVILKQRWKVPNWSSQKVYPCIKTKLDRV